LKNASNSPRVALVTGRKVSFPLIVVPGAVQHALMHC
jgi:hypothetical protein